MPAAFLIFQLLIKSRRTLKETQRAYEKLQSEIKAAPPPKRPKFGAYWDENLEPFCPVHQEVHLGNWVGRLGNRRLDAYYCPATGHYVPLRDDEGSHLTPKDAKARLSADDRPTANKVIEMAAK